MKIISNWINRMKFREKMVLLMSILLSLAGLLISWNFISATRALMYENLKTAAMAVTQSLTYGAPYGILLNDAEVAGQLISGTVQHLDINHIMIILMDGRILAHSDKSRNNTVLNDKVTMQGLKSKTLLVHDYISKEGKQEFEVTAPVFGAVETGVPEMLGIIRLGVSTKSAESKLKELTMLSSTVTFAVVSLTILILLYLLKIIIKPVEEMLVIVNKIADGDFTQQLDIRSQDEIGQLGKAFLKMSEKIKITLSQIKNVADILGRSSKDILASSEYIQHGARSQAQSINSTESAIDGLNLSIKEITNNIETLSTVSASSFSSINQMSHSITEVATSSNNLTDAVSETISGISQITSSIKNVADNIETLSENMNETDSSAKEINVELGTIREKAKESSRLSLKVTNDAEELGMAAIRKTIMSMEEIERRIESASEVINRLGDRSGRIGKVLTVIDEVTKQTNLLALNAAILAAQAGEQGKGFAVVADEIKNLADRTDASTHEIAALITSVQDETTDAVQSIKIGAESVKHGMGISLEAGDALEKILESSKLATKMSISIEGSTNHLIKAIEDITSSIDESNSMTLQISKSTKQQKAVTNILMGTSDKMNQIATQVYNSTDKQKDSSSMITDSVQNISELIVNIVESIQLQKTGTETIKMIVKDINTTSQDAVLTTSSMSKVIDVLYEHSNLLQVELDKFKLE